MSVVMRTLLAATVLVLVPFAMAALSRERATDSDFPGMCLGRSTGTILAEGDSKTLPHCARVSCHKQGNDMILQTVTCGNVMAAYPCEVRSEPSLDYPDCCPDIYCPK